MIERKSIPVDEAYSIDVVTERMRDGGWAVVASIKHRSPNGEKPIDLPVGDLRYSRPGRGRGRGHPSGPRLALANVSHAA